MLGLKDKIVLITGSTSGIGQSIAVRFAEEGSKVAINYRKAEMDAAETDSLVHQAHEHYMHEMEEHGEDHILVKADVSKPEDVEAMVQDVIAKFGGLDFLINNAGIGIFRPVGEMSPDDWRQTIGTNLTGVFLCCREVIPRMRNASGSWIVNISSLAGKNPFAKGAAYNASKFGLNGFTEAMMMDHRYDNIRVSYIMPGSVETEFSPGTSKADWKIAPEDIAEIVLSILRMPERTLISRVEVRPSKPQK
jgi:NAD(P)-dependent dehydrogenase (short-subunit alcohol dehydrogenase family)